MLGGGRDTIQEGWLAPLVRRTPFPCDRCRWAAVCAQLGRDLWAGAARPPTCMGCLGRGSLFLKHPRWAQAPPRPAWSSSSPCPPAPSSLSLPWIQQAPSEASCGRQGLPVATSYGIPAMGTSVPSCCVLRPYPSPGMQVADAFNEAGHHRQPWARNAVAMDSDQHCPLGTGQEPCPRRWPLL